MSAFYPVWEIPRLRGRDHGEKNYIINYVINLSLSPVFLHISFSLIFHFNY